MELRKTIKTPSRYIDEQYYTEPSKSKRAEAPLTHRPHIVEYDPSLPPAAFPSVQGAVARQPHQEKPKPGQSPENSPLYFGHTVLLDPEPASADILFALGEDEVPLPRSNVTFAEEDGIIKQCERAQIESNMALLEQICNRTDEDWIALEMDTSDEELDESCEDDVQTETVAPTWQDLSDGHRLSIVDALADTSDSLEKLDLATVASTFDLDDTQTRRMQILAKERDNEYRLEEVKIREFQAAVSRQLLAIKGRGLASVSQSSYRSLIDEYLLKELVTPRQYVSTSKELAVACAFLRNHGLPVSILGDWSDSSRISMASNCPLVAESTEPFEKRSESQAQTQTPALLELTCRAMLHPLQTPISEPQLQQQPSLRRTTKIRLSTPFADAPEQQYPITPPSEDGALAEKQLVRPCRERKVIKLILNPPKESPSEAPPGAEAVELVEDTAQRLGPKTTSKARTKHDGRVARVDMSPPASIKVSSGNRQKPKKKDLKDKDIPSSIVEESPGKLAQSRTPPRLKQSSSRQNKARADHVALNLDEHSRSPCREKQRQLEEGLSLASATSDQAFSPPAGYPRRKQPSKSAQKILQKTPSKLDRSTNEFNAEKEDTLTTSSGQRKNVNRATETTPQLLSPSEEPAATTPASSIQRSSSTVKTSPAKQDQTSPKPNTKSSKGLSMTPASPESDHRSRKNIATNGRSRGHKRKNGSPSPDRETSPKGGTAKRSRKPTPRRQLSGNRTKRTPGPKRRKVDERAAEGSDGGG